MKHPYENVPDSRRWSRAVAGRKGSEIDPAIDVTARIGAEDRIVSAGSCFAQHVTRHLQARGLRCMLTESGHPLLGEEIAREFNYGVYAARYGNMYVTRHLLQLWLRATGAFVPAETYWEDDGAFYDPFRPTIQPGGFPTLAELEADRRQHFAAVRDAFTRMDVLIFTMGLTECWTSVEDGAVYPLCPGVACGRFDPERHVMVNLTADQVAADMEELIARVREVNPGLRVIMTVSPQPQTATAEERHVLVEAGYSKAKLRVAAERICRLPEVDYFPSYETIGVPGSRYFQEDRRSVTEEGIARVMELFFEHVVDDDAIADRALGGSGDDAFLAGGELLLRVFCDEDLLDGGKPPEKPRERDPLPETYAPRSVTELQRRRVEARALALEGRFEEAIALAEAIQREHPGPGIALLIQRWRARIAEAAGAPSAAQGMRRGSG